MDSSTAWVKLSITGMQCAGCARTVEKALRGVDGVSAVSVDLAASTALVSIEPGPTGGPNLVQAALKAGYKVEECLPEGTGRDGPSGPR